PVLDVHAHLDEPLARELEAECANSGKAAAGLTDDRGNGPGHLDRRRAKVHVERDQGPSRTYEHGAGRPVQPVGPEVGTDLAAFDTPLQLVEPALAEERRPATGGTVQEDGKA